MRRKLKLIRRLKVIGQYEKEDENVIILIIEKPKIFKDKKIEIQVSEEIISLKNGRN